MSSETAGADKNKKLSMLKTAKVQLHEIPLEPSAAAPVAWGPASRNECAHRAAIPAGAGVSLSIPGALRRNSLFILLTEHLRHKLSQAEWPARAAPVCWATAGLGAVPRD